ncbi:MAG TPA: FkbM family methyltransferase [Pyrinomonadaceae bacterium]|nr:FkbM family methyltransferase [Pyrinomonadaceae bacterium]
MRAILRRAGVGRFLLNHIITPSQQIANRRFPDRDTEVQINGHRLLVFSPRTNLIGRALYQNGVWEPAVTDAIEKKTRPGMVAIDVGADIGYYALQMSRLAGRQGRVIAFEPIPAARHHLEHNIELNGLTNIEVCGYALGNEAGTVYLEDPLKKSRINLNKSSAGERDIEVSIKRFDDLVGEMNLPSVDIVKMDIEGAEHLALLGMEQSIRRFRPILIVEVHNHFLPLFGSSSQQLLSWLKTLGYEITQVDSSETVDNVTLTVCCEFSRP